MNIYDEIEKNNIKLTYADIDNNGFSYLDNIIVNNKLSPLNEKMTVAEELAHYNVGVSPTLPYNTDYSNRLVRSRNEFKAFKWMQCNLLPQGIENIKYNDIWSIADKFEVTPEFVERVIEYRKEQENYE